MARIPTFISKFRVITAEYDLQNDDGYYLVEDLEDPDKALYHIYIQLSSKQLLIGYNYTMKVKRILLWGIHTLERFLFPEKTPICIT